MTSLVDIKARLFRIFNYVDGFAIKGHIQPIQVGNLGDLKLLDITHLLPGEISYVYDASDTTIDNMMSFKWDKLSNLPPDNVYCVQPNSMPSNGRWIRILDAHLVHCPGLLVDALFYSAATMKDQQVIFVKGTTAIGVSPGHYYLDKTDTTSADNGTTIRVGAGGARWKKLT